MEKPDLPKTFVDDAARSWTVKITWSTKKRILDVAGMDLNDLVNVEAKKVKSPVSAFTALITDFEQMSAMLYAILKPECEALTPPLSLDDFRDGIIGNAVLDARNALAQAIYDFFPDPQKSLLGWAITAGLSTEKKTQAKLNETSARMVTAISERTDRELAELPDPVPLMNAALDAKKKEQIVTPLIPPSSDAPASSASTPTP